MLALLCKEKSSDYSASAGYSVRPEGCEHFFAYVDFIDNSYMLLDRIFAVTRAEALLIALNRFGDCMNYISGIRLYQSGEE